MSFWYIAFTYCAGFVSFPVIIIVAGVLFYTLRDWRQKGKHL